jgi:hypothetical protein
LRLSLPRRLLQRTPPTGGSQVGAFSSAAGASSASSMVGSVVPAAPSGEEFATFSLAHGFTGSLQPFAFGHAFADNDVPAGSVALGDSASWQCSPLTYWPSGCLKHAIIAGRITATSGVDSSISLSAGADPGGTALTEANLASALPVVTIAAGAHTLTLSSLVGTAALKRTVCSGPVMSNWIYRQPVTGSSHLVIWVDVRLYVGGHIEIFPWVENAYLTVASPTNDSRSYTVTIAGAVRFGPTVIDVKHRTRIPLVTGSTFSYWVGTDPQITPKHDRAYLMSTKLVPNYGWISPSSTALDALQQTYTANTLAGISSSMGVAGSSGALIPSEQALYVTSGGDARAYKSALVFGLSGGSWSTHYRDSSTNDPLKFSSYPSADLDSGGTPTIPDGTGGTNGTAVTTHQPSYGYLPFLVTGRWWFLEESMFWCTWNYLKSAAGARRGWTDYGTAPYLFANGSYGVIDPRHGGYANRGGHWSIRILAQTLALTPSSHGLYTDLKTAWESNTDFYNQAFVAGTFAPGWVSPQGFLGDYSSDGTSAYGSPGGSTAWWGAAWMSNFGGQAWGFSSDIGLPQTSASLTRHLAVRNQAYKQVIQRAGDGSGSNYNWRRFIVYSYPIGTDGTGLPPETMYTSTQSYAAYLSGYSLASIPATAGLTLKEHSSDVDLFAGSSSGIDASGDAGYGAFALSALAYAVSHGASGAAEGWSRVTSASNFAASFAKLNDSPEHGIGTPTPTWAVGQAVNEWRQIAGSAMSLCPPTVNPGSKDVKFRIDPWVGFSIDTRSNTVWAVANGGHDDYWGNEVLKICLNDASPAWVEVSPSDTLSSAPGDVSYYPSGRPTSSHTYYTQHFIERDNRAVRVGNGSAASVGNPKFDVSAYNASATGPSGWLPQGTYPNIPGTGVPITVAKDPSTEDFYAFVNNNNIWKWTHATGAWTALSVSLPVSFKESACAFDSSRNRIFLLKGAESAVCHTVTLSSGNTVGTVAAVTLFGTGAAAVSAAVKGIGMVYVAALDAYFVRLRAAGGSVYRINASTFETTLVTTTGGSSIPITPDSSGTPENVYGRFLYAPSLGGVFYTATHSDHSWFLRLH